MRVIKTIRPTHIACGFLAATLLAPSALARSENFSEPAAVVDTAVERTIDALQDTRISDAEADAILALIDIERVAPFTLGKHWRTADEATKTAFIAAFQEFSREQLREHLSGFANADVEIVRTIERKEGDAVVITNVSGVDDEEHVVSWRVNDRDGWKVTDIEVAGLWFAIEQRAQFQAVLDQNGGDIEGLMSKMKSGF